MAYIYKIINNINQKIYIGKTLRTLEIRWKEHIRNSNSPRNEKRPLYDAMNKYGVENFSIELVEEVKDEIASEREKYWIETYASFKNGYNATIGGDGTPYINRRMVIKTYEDVQNCAEVARIMGISVYSVRNVLSDNNIKICSSGEIAKKQSQKIVKMLSRTGEFIAVFNNYKSAADYLIENNLTQCKNSTARTHISEVCRGKRKSFANFIWILESE